MCPEIAFLVLRTNGLTRLLTIGRHMPSPVCLVWRELEPWGEDCRKNQNVVNESIWYCGFCRKIKIKRHENLSPLCRLVPTHMNLILPTGRDSLHTTAPKTTNHVAITLKMLSSRGSNPPHFAQFMSFCLQNRNGFPLNFKRLLLYIYQLFQGKSSLLSILPLCRSRKI